MTASTADHGHIFARYHCMYSCCMPAPFLIFVQSYGIRTNNNAALIVLPTTTMSFNSISVVNTPLATTLHVYPWDRSLPLRSLGSGSVLHWHKSRFSGCDLFVLFKKKDVKVCNRRYFVWQKENTVFVSKCTVHKVAWFFITVWCSYFVGSKHAYETLKWIAGWHFWCCFSQDDKLKERKTAFVHKNGFLCGLICNAADTGAIHHVNCLLGGEW